MPTTLLSEEQRAFERQADRWEQYTRTRLGRLRQDLVIHHLLQHLAARPPGLRVLDAGAGAGGYAVALTQAGHHVCLVDFAPAMLAIARQNLHDAGVEFLGRAEFVCASVEHVPACLPHRSYDVVLCHTLLEYVEYPDQVLRGLVAMLAPGATLSLLLTNPHAEALQWAIAKRDLDRALDALRAPTSQADLFGLPRRTVDPATAAGWLSGTGLRVAADHGVRIFADYLAHADLADDAIYERLWRLELAASQVEPYRAIARYRHILAVRQSVEPEPAM